MYICANNKHLTASTMCRAFEIMGKIEIYRFLPQFPGTESPNSEHFLCEKT